MNELRSLADQLRSKISAPDTPQANPKKIGKRKENVSTIKSTISEIKQNIPPNILQEIHAYDNRNHKNMVHVRFDASTAQLLNQFKMATQVDISKLVSFSVQKLFQNHPELKLIIKEFIQKLEL